MLPGHLKLQPPPRPLQHAHLQVRKIPLGHAFRIGNREVSLHHLKLAGDLSRERKWLLGSRLLPQSPSATNPFSMLYENAKQSLRSRDLDAATLSIMRLRWFRERLTEVAHHDYKFARLFFR